MRAENLKKEKDILKMSDVRLTQQRDSLLVEQRGQNLLLTNLRTIQVYGAILVPRLGLSVRLSNKYPCKSNKRHMGFGLHMDFYVIASQHNITYFSKFGIPVLHYDTLLFTWAKSWKFWVDEKDLRSQMETKHVKQSERKKFVVVILMIAKFNTACCGSWFCCYIIFTFLHLYNLL